MAGMAWSALVQETVSRGVSFVLGKREEKASQGHLLERLEMAVSELEFALERAQELPIRHLSLIRRRKLIKCAYVKAVELLDKHKQQQAVPEGQELKVAQGAKRKRWVICDLKPFVALTTDAVRRFECYVECAGRFVRELESGCSLYHNTLCNPIVRHLLEGKSIWYSHFDQGNPLRRILKITPLYSDERGVEACLKYYSYDCSLRTTEKNFSLVLQLRLSESTDIVGVAIKGLHLLAPECKPAAEFAMGELSRLSNLQDISNSHGSVRVGLQEMVIKFISRLFRPDPACCQGSRHGLCGNNNNVSTELSDIFSEQVIYWTFQCYYVPALEPSSFDMVARSESIGGGKPPLLLRTAFLPHYHNDNDSCAVEIVGAIIKVYRDPCSIQQVARALSNSDAINCFFHQPELTKYIIVWYSKHGGAWFTLEKTSTKRVGSPKTKRYNTRGSTRRSG